ncbi:vacuolar fusion protein ccz1 [Dimargaris cristalligena]|nr:vacuolar fusion protein ccz1 [Dimargaris cristalligena]
MGNESKTVRHDPSLAFFTVFNPALGPDEDTAHEQLLYYVASSNHPQSGKSPPRADGGDSPIVTSTSAPPTPTTTTIPVTVAPNTPTQPFASSGRAYSSGDATAAAAPLAIPHSPLPPSTESPSLSLSTSPNQPGGGRLSSSGQKPGWGEYLWNGVKYSFGTASHSPSVASAVPTSPPIVGSSPRLSMSVSTAAPDDQYLHFPFATEPFSTTQTASAATIPLDAKIRQIGLIQGLATCASTFSSDETWYSIHAHKTRILVYRPEPNIWVSLGVNLGYTVDGPEQNYVYNEKEVSDDELATLVIQSYQTYCLLYNSFSATLNITPPHLGVRLLRRQLEDYYGDLVWQWNFRDFSLFQTLRGIPSQMLPKSTFSKFQALFSDVEAQTCPAAGTMMVLWRRQLVWSTGLEADDVYTLYWYLAATYGQTALESVNDIKPPSAGLDEERRIKFIRPLSEDAFRPKTAPPERTKRAPHHLRRSRSRKKEAPGEVLYLGDAGQAHRCVLLTAAQQSADQSPEPTADSEGLEVGSENGDHRPTPTSPATMNEDIKKLVAEHAPSLSTAVTTHWHDVQMLITGLGLRGFRFVHMNYVNLALHASWMNPFRGPLAEHTPGRAINATLHQHIRQLHEQFERQQGELREGAVCTLKNGWVAGVRNQECEYYVVIDKPGSNLLSVDDCLRQVSGLFINNVFLD